MRRCTQRRGAARVLPTRDPSRIRSSAEWQGEKRARARHARSCKARNALDSQRMSKDSADARRNCARVTPYASQFRRGIPGARGKCSSSVGGSPGWR